METIFKNFYSVNDYLPEEIEFYLRLPSTLSSRAEMKQYIINIKTYYLLQNKNFMFIPYNREQDFECDLIDRFKCKIVQEKVCDPIFSNPNASLNEYSLKEMVELLKRWEINKVNFQDVNEETILRHIQTSKILGFQYRLKIHSQIHRLKIHSQQIPEVICKWLTENFLDYEFAEKEGGFIYPYHDTFIIEIKPRTNSEQILLKL